MNKKIVIGSLVFLAISLHSQIFTSKSSKVHFFSTTPVEDIEATSNSSSSAINTESGSVSFKLEIKTFKFKSALMQEHFNENYMESEKYPLAEFKGKIVDMSKVDFSKPGEYNVELDGDLTIHGVKKPRKINGVFTIKDGAITGTSKFTVALADHNIERPKIVFEKIAEAVDVDVSFEYVPYVKK